MKVSKWPSLVRFACQLIRDEELDLRWNFSARFCLFFRSVSAVHLAAAPKKKNLCQKHFDLRISEEGKYRNIAIGRAAKVPTRGTHGHGHAAHTWTCNWNSNWWSLSFNRRYRTPKISPYSGRSHGRSKPTPGLPMAPGDKRMDRREWHAAPRGLRRPHFTPMIGRIHTSLKIFYLFEYFASL